MTAAKTMGAILLAGMAGWLAGLCAQTRAQTALPLDINSESRNRLPPPKREDFKDADLKLFDEIMSHQQGGLAPRAKQRPLLRMYSPGLAKGLEEVHAYLRNETRLGDRVTTIAVLTTSRELGNQYEWTQWEEHARIPTDARHLEPRVIDAIKNCGPVAGLDEKDAAVIEFGRELFGARRVSSETFARVLGLFGPHDLVDLEEVMGMYAATAAELVAFDQQLNEGQKGLLPAGVGSCTGVR
jgi:4-carboxymuconolactone decarboxylase